MKKNIVFFILFIFLSSVAFSQAVSNDYILLTYKADSLYL